MSKNKKKFLKNGVPVNSPLPTQVPFNRQPLWAERYGQRGSFQLFYIVKKEDEDVFLKHLLTPQNSTR